jgi:ATP-dependent Clp protease ATP-binding subunit ClpA
MQASRMFERFDAESRGVINRAQEIARELRHNWIGTEHLLLGLEGSAGEDVLRLVGSGPSPLTGAPAFTPRAKKALELALRGALERGDRTIRPEHVLLGLVKEGEGVGYRVLAEAGVTAERLVAMLGWPPGPRARRRFLRGLGIPAPTFPAPGGTLASGRLALTAQALAGSGPVGSHHYLLAMFQLENALAAKVLESLGVTKEQVEATIAELGTAGTSDEPPQVAVDIGGQRYTVTPEQADQLRQWLSGGEPPPSAA